MVDAAIKAEISPLPWVLIEADENHGAYIVNAWHGDVADLYAMSNSLSASVRNGGTSVPIPFLNADANAAFIVRAVNAHDDLVEALACEKALDEGNFEVLSKYGYDGPHLFVQAAEFCDKKTEAALAKASGDRA